MEVEATADDADAILAANITDFDPGDVIGKLLAFIAQIRQCSEGTRAYLIQLCVENGCPLEIVVWVHTWWGSLYDCFDRVIAVRKVRICQCGSIYVLTH